MRACSIPSRRVRFHHPTFSYGMDRRWKRTGLEQATLPDKPVVRSIAAGTGDFP